jgi:hypothetical protein
MNAKGEPTMTHVVVHSTSGPDGKLHLEVPVGVPNTDFEVQVVARPKPLEPAKARKATTPAQWRAWVESMAGSWEGDFERPPQGGYETREPLS